MSENSSKAFGIASLVLGAVGLFVLPLLFGILGLIFGLLSITNAYKKVFSIIGIIFSSVDLLWWLIVILAG